jgi:RimJ/RimL family protein N-acetyltransferase
VEIGWTWLAPSAQRTAINTEAKLLMLTFAFEEWKVDRVCLRTDRRNERSRNAIERLGATLDGVIRADRPGSDGTIRDTAHYSIVADEWPAVRDRLRLRTQTAARHPG